ncbi:cytochrome p450 89a2 [Phtheirospermum japonicum]|uniref:Cytochrome p450 89a2 n=1 Tax=Phtheirospermum japonicum TaxID=374723 RepID=A0A830D009_9LAMI|nr:cytochrome p450 89a2 [Phtheirospermum japonicum]
MEVWFIFIVSLCISALVKFICSLLLSSTKKKNLPPGPTSIPLIGNLIWLCKPISDLEFVLRSLKPRYGPLITLMIGHRPFIFVGSRSIAHRALIGSGGAFSDRPAPTPTQRIFNKTGIAISSSLYGPTWRLLRRNLMHEILHPSRVRLYSTSRRRALSVLVNPLRSDSSSPVRLTDHFRYAMFCLLVLMCFGDDNVEENQIKEMEGVLRSLLLGSRRFNVLNMWPRLGKIVFRKRWKELIQLRQDWDKVLIPLIRACLQSNLTIRKTDHEVAVAYVDTLVDLQIPGEVYGSRKLDEDEMVGLCTEFLSAGTDTTSATLQWIMANLVKYPRIQDKLYQEIIQEDDLQKMPYLKAVVLEALRRHPPGHFVLPHKVTRADVELDGYAIPENAVVNFMVADMGWDPQVWEDPMEFKPERFLGETFDVTGSREIKMMPFGAGRRICPASALALLHLEYFVANLIWNFEWTSPQGHEIDLSEKQEFSTVMKNPLHACISPRM